MEESGHVLMFHHVSDENIEDMPDCCICKVHRFRDIIDSYISKGWRFITPGQLIDGGDVRHTVLITFDDITDDVYSNAFPYLVERGIPFTIFVTTRYINVANYITLEHLMEMVNSPLCTLGAHTLSHPMLRNVENSMTEIEKSKQELEEMFHRDVLFFAYPYGKRSSVSRRIERFVKESGFLLAFGTIDAPVSSKSLKRRYYIPRMVKN